MSFAALNIFPGWILLQQPNGGIEYGWLRGRRYSGLSSTVWSSLLPARYSL
ncbi:hypothetical protein ES703_56529 [subsurface metagenome]